MLKTAYIWIALLIEVQSGNLQYFLNANNEVTDVLRV